MKISVIVPVYNCEQYLPALLDSVLAQTYQNFEIILVNDGSRDGSGTICDAYAAQDSRIRVIHQENGGVSRARNRGLELAAGDAVSFIDSDDILEPDMYELLAEGIVKYGLMMSQISRDEVDEAGNRMPDVCVPPKEEWLITSQEMLNELLMHRGDASFCTRLTAKELFDGLAFPEGKLNEDFYLLIQMLGRIDYLVILLNSSYLFFYHF